MAVPVSVIAQSGVLKGKLTDEITGREVDYGQVLNYSRNINILSDRTGEFVLEANLGDTLVFFALGYYYHKVIVTDSLLKAGTPVIFVMRSQVYEISEAQIFSLGTYNDFRHSFINLDKPRTRTEKLADELADVSHRAARESYNAAQANRKLDGITFLSVPIRGPEERERLKLSRMVEKEKTRNLIYQKFNPEVVRKVTGLTDDDDILDFMAFCDFSDHYLLEVNEIDLMARIALKFEAFRKERQGSDSGDNPGIPDRNFYSIFG